MNPVVIRIDGRAYTLRLRRARTWRQRRRRLATQLTTFDGAQNPARQAAYRDAIVESVSFLIDAPIALLQMLSPGELRVICAGVFLQESET